jgi:hypothetical protein
MSVPQSTSGAQLSADRAIQNDALDRSRAAWLARRIERQASVARVPDHGL